MINDTQKFPSMSSSIPLLKDENKCASCDVDSLLTNILAKETINFVLEENYVHKKLKSIFSKLIFSSCMFIKNTSLH